MTTSPSKPTDILTLKKRIEESEHKLAMLNLSIMTLKFQIQLIKFAIELQKITDKLDNLIEKGTCE